VSISKRDNN
jgi:hypothetical protein